MTVATGPMKSIASETPRLDSPSQLSPRQVNSAVETWTIRLSNTAAVAWKRTFTGSNGCRSPHSCSGTTKTIAQVSLTDSEFRRSEWCRRRDLNPHALSSATPSRWCVCQVPPLRHETAPMRSQESDRGRPAAYSGPGGSLSAGGAGGASVAGTGSCTPGPLR